MKTDRSELHGAYVWILSATALIVYGVLGYLDMKIPGIEELVAFIESVNGGYVYLAAFLSVFIEGLYFIGSVFPGSTLIVLLAVISQISGFVHFASVIFMIFIGWCCSGMINIYVARTYRNFILRSFKKEDKEVKDNIWMTWFPAFRSNHEVAQVTEGVAPRDVFWSSVKVKFKVSFVVAIGTLILPIFLDINDLSNKEGFVTLVIVATITLSVGIQKIRRFHKRTVPNT